MTHDKAKTHIRAFKHPANQRRWAIEFRVGVQGFVIDTGMPLTKKECDWWMKQLETALCNL